MIKINLERQYGYFRSVHDPTDFHIHRRVEDINSGCGHKKYNLYSMIYNLQDTVKGRE